MDEKKLKVVSGNVKLSKHIDWTEDQEIAAKKIINWVNSGKETMMTLSGFAGTGKTTLLKEIIRHIKGSTAITAPTHKAVRIASNMVGITGQTIHKLLGLRPNVSLENFDYNNPQFDPKGNRYIKNYHLIIIDEASMISYDLHKLLKDEAEEFRVKILYVGDECQLPPINEKQSVAFRNPNIVRLSTIVRQENDNPLIFLLTKLREDIKYGSRGFLTYMSKHKNSLINDKGFLVCKDANHFNNILLDHFNTSEFEKNIDFTKYLAFTNSSILEYNNFIRESIINHEGETLCQDDLLISYSTILDEFNAPIIINSEDYIVEEISDYTNMNSIKGFLVKLKCVNNGMITKPLFIIDHNHVESIGLFVKLLNTYVSAAKSATSGSQRASRWKEFYTFKASHLLMSNIVTPTGTKIVDKDLDYGFGLTVHKSQGSTFDNIFVNIHDIIYYASGLPNNDIFLTNKLCYVALSRAKNKAIILL